MIAFVVFSRTNLLFWIVIYLFVKVQSKVKDTKLIDGLDVTAGEGLFMASLLRYPDGQLICGAAFYTPTMLITACSCISDAAHGTAVDFPEQSLKGFRVAAGSNYNFKLEDNHVLLEVAQLITHPECEYDAYVDMWIRDLGIIVVKKPVNESVTLKYISYPHPDDYFYSLLSILDDQSYWVDGKKSCHIFGWGYTSYVKNRYRFIAYDPVPFLKTRAMQIMVPDDCQQELCEVNKKVCNFWPNTNWAFCAMATEPGKGSFCIGDYGSPFVCDGIMYGIASWNYDCGTSIKANIIHVLDIMFMNDYLSCAFCHQTYDILVLTLFITTIFV